MSPDGRGLTMAERETKSSDDLDFTKKSRHLWVQCENCYGLYIDG